MNTSILAERTKNIHNSYANEVLSATTNPDVISLAFGLPDQSIFPIIEMKNAANKALEADGESILQYSTTKGYLPLREYIANRYIKKGLQVNPDEILITNGSQQALDLLGKIFINKNDHIAIEKPGYLGAIQAFSMYEPQYYSVVLNEDGIDTDTLNNIVIHHSPKLFYSVPNFQNPTGLTYTNENRQKVANVLMKTETFFVEDDPYSDLRFLGNNKNSMKKYLPENTILLGSFSKTVSPGMRMGWVCANLDVIDQLVIVKQASDLHSNYFTQRIIYQYLADNDLDQQIYKIRELYRLQRNYMLNMIDLYIPHNITATRPEGGMFLWLTLPRGMSSVKLFDIAVKKNVVFVPGDAFFVDEYDVNAIRLNYTNSTQETMETGIKRLAQAIFEYG